jgi:basic membrane lipoprotein Med (substrate-binding protein (PBP1-ABC) superfamily)
LKNKINKRYKVQGTREKALLSFATVLLVACSLFLVPSFSSCHFKYGFKDVSPISDSIKTVKVTYIENKARYINPQLSPRLTDKLRQKIISQTKLSQTNSDNADWEISGYITDYSFTTSAISGQQVANNRLTVGIHITLNNRKQEDIKDYDVSRNFEFKGNQSFQQAEASLLDEIIRTLTDEIFNKIFSSW